MKKLINWIINSKHSETITSILIGISFIGVLALVFLLYISVN